MNFWRKQLGFILAAAVLAGCSSPTVNIALRRAHLISQRVYYVQAEQFKTFEFAPPSAMDSDAQKADSAVIFDWQKKRTEADCAKASETAGADYNSFWNGKNPFPAPLPGEVKSFFMRLTGDLDEAMNNMKERYKRPRPYTAYPGEAVPCIKKSSSFSYPSGHTTFSRVFANVLTDIIPERKDEFFKKADEIALDRVIGGVHYPSDIAAGKVFADRFHGELLKSPEYRKDIERIKTCLVR